MTQKRLKKLPAQGSPDAVGIFQAVGQALSWWEAAEDALLDLFSFLCAELEPTAFSAYVAGTRRTRSVMLQVALQNHAARVTDEDVKAINVAAREIDKLASVRNEIAHGYVRHVTINHGDEVVAKGNYLLPSQNENGRFERDVRYHHTSESVEQFTESVRDARWSIVQITINLMQREQGLTQDAGVEASMHLRDAIDIAWRRIDIANAKILMRSHSERSEMKANKGAGF